MKRITLLAILCIVIVSTSFSQDFRKHSWGDSMAKVKAAEGNIIILASSDTTGSGDKDILLLKVSKTELGMSQPFPIPAEGAEWNNTIIQTDTQGPTQGTTRLQAKGDTIINNLTYSKLFTTWGSSYFQTGECEFHFLSTSYINRYEGAIRTDDDYRVSYINPSETEPIILYDFSRSVGDSVLISKLNNPYFAYVMQIDTIMVGDNPRKQMTMEGMYGWEDTWIEGIGSLYGLLTTEMRSWEFTDYELTCYKENNTPLFSSHPTCTRCDIATTIESDILHESITVFPNPANDYILIKSDDVSDIGLVEIFDFAGKVVLTYQATQLAREYRIGIEELSEGFYVVRFRLKDNYQVQRFVKR